MDTAEDVGKKAPNYSKRRQAWKRNKMKDEKQRMPLIRRPCRQAWKKGFSLSSGPDPCVLD